MTAAVQEVHEMVIADPSKPVKFTWNGLQEERAAVEAEFNARMETGLYMAYQTIDVDKPTKRHEQITDFEPEAERIILAPRLVGGCL